MPYTTTGGVKKMARYRYNFEIRRTPDSDNDFTNVFSLVDAANRPVRPTMWPTWKTWPTWKIGCACSPPTTRRATGIPSGANGQNLYGYIGTLGTKYSLLMWDFNIVIGNSGSWGAGPEFVRPSMARITHGGHLQ